MFYGLKQVPYNMRTASMKHAIASCRAPDADAAAAGAVRPCCGPLAPELARSLLLRPACCLVPDAGRARAEVGPPLVTVWTKFMYTQ